MDLFIDNVFTSFEQLHNKQNLPDSHFFKYSQVQSFVKQNNALYPLAPEQIMDLILLVNLRALGPICYI